MPFDSINIESELTSNLRKAWSLIDSPEKWTRLTLYRYRNNQKKFCSVGAINEVCGYNQKRAGSVAMVKALYDAIPADIIADFSPTLSTRDKVMRYNDDYNSWHTLQGWWQKAIEQSIANDLK